VTCRPVPDVFPGHDAQPWSRRSTHPLESVRGASRRKQALCDTHRILNPRGPAGFQRNEGVHVRTLIRDGLTGPDHTVKSNLPLPGALVGFWWADLLGGGSQRTVEPFYSSGRKKRDDTLEDAFDQAMIILVQQWHQAIRKPRLLGIRVVSHQPKNSLGSIPKNLLHLTGRVIDALENALGRRKKAQTLLSS
jgi:hypothetical protein